MRKYDIERLGKCELESPLTGLGFIRDEERILYHVHLSRIERYIDEGEPFPAFELCGPRRKIYFDPATVKCGIVTCGGICPGINDVIRSIVLSLHYHYGVNDILGFRYGFKGLCPSNIHTSMKLSPDMVDDIHQKGGTVLGTSRGPEDVCNMLDTLQSMGIGILFVIGGDGGLRGARSIAEEAERRQAKIAVIGIPKTIDNDISYVQQSFGFATAVSATRTAINAAHVEATGARHGIGLVKFMGRESGFVTAYATLATSDVNYCLVPEVRFHPERFLPDLRRRLLEKEHAVIAVAEGAGQDLIGVSEERDPSGNIRFGDIGLFLKNEIQDYFKRIGMDYTLKYIDPSYTIRALPANAHDAVFCLQLGHHAVHAAMAGRTNMLVGFWQDQFIHVPISLAVSKRKQIDPKGRLWNSVLAATGQPHPMV